MKKGHAALRRGRHRPTAGSVHLVTFTTAGRCPHFSSGPVALAMCRELTDAFLWQESRLLAWVLMPDHWHGLVEVGASDALSRRIRHLKGRSARRLHLRYPRLSRIWAKGYHDRVVLKDTDLIVAARYIVMNPVRAGMVRRIGDYPFWDSVWV